jgi:DNA-binding transcriptional ArsR family regulator
MKEGPDIAQIGALIGDPARANMLTALMDGKALTATELAAAGGVTVQTASTHLAKLEAGQLLAQRKQGRHRYFTLADDGVGKLLESIMGFAAGRGHLRHRPGPKEPALRKARICYDHLAGDYGVRMLDSLITTGAIGAIGDGLAITSRGASELKCIGIDVGDLQSSRRPLCRSCLDWSERRAHLAGSLGKALLSNLFDKGWARRRAAVSVALSAATFGRSASCHIGASLTLFTSSPSTDDGKRFPGACALLSGLRRTADPLHVPLERGGGLLYPALPQCQQDGAVIVVRALFPA